MYRLAAAIGTRILYHSHLDDGSEAVIDDAGLTVVRGIGKRVTAPFGLAERLPTPANRRYRTAVASLHLIQHPSADVIASYCRQTPAAPARFHLAGAAGFQIQAISSRIRSTLESISWSAVRWTCAPELAPSCARVSR
ncbi:hypothetical protein [Streptomyces sp. TLI_053]|uniref:hypothetical protein n=1 Tax=Streptomyces sp. TLI_053 TaxID=1855352 RepID=UPI0013520D80|nr:hypothetical protein [Streptomyces sp. TLI_053]